MPGPSWRRALLQRTLPLAFISAFAACEAADGNVDDEKFVCRTQAECGDGMKCGAGPGCFCVCMAPDQTPNTACADPNCLNPQTTE
ncbi:MAG: hypothetical protein IV100_01425 [Myxococcales bacterium]|nr:hypothetical protein [Myxococcales bacterium]